MNYDDNFNDVADNDNVDDYYDHDDNYVDDYYDHDNNNTCLTSS